MKHALILIFLKCLFLKEQVRQNFMVNFEIDQLKQQIQEHKYVVAAFVDQTSFSADTILSAFTEISVDLLGTNDLIFLIMNIEDFNHQHYEEYSLTHKNEIHLYINGFKIKYNDIIQNPMIAEWLNETLKADGKMIKDLEETKDDGNFNFVYAKTQLTQDNTQQIKLLAEMIYPIRLYTGLEKQLEDTALPEGDLFLFRKYQSEYVKIEYGNNTIQIAKEIENKKFPPFLQPNEDSYDLVFGHKISTLIYYCQDMDDEIIQVLKLVIKQHREYLELMIVNPSEDNIYGQFFMDIMGVKFSRQLRILDASNDLKRYKYIGNLEANLIDFFIENYLHQNIRTYSISENITQRYDKNLKILSGNDVKTLQDVKTYVIYVYGGMQYDDEEFQKHLTNMHELADEYQKNFKFVFATVDRNQNDIKDVKFEELPLFMIYQGKNMKEKILSNDYDVEKFKELVQKYHDKV